MIARLVRVLGAPFVTTHPREHADAIVVLGSKLRPDGSLSQVGEERLSAGVALHREGLAPVLALTGFQAPGAPVAEAVALARRARELGVPDSALRIETEASNTADNARFTAKILLAENRTRVWIVTQPFHLRRALFWFRRAGLHPLGHHIADSVQYRETSLAVKWIAQEYVSWTKLWVLEAVPPLRRRR